MNFSFAKEARTYKKALGVIQQLRGQEGGEGGSAKSPRLSTQGGGSLDVHVDKNLKEKYKTIMTNHYI